MTDKDLPEVEALRRTVELIPDVGLQLDSAKVGSDLDKLALVDLANRVIADAEASGKPEIAAEARAIIESLEPVEAHADEMTKRRHEAEERARETLRRIDEG